MQHGQFVKNLEAVVLSLLQGVVGQVKVVQVHQILEVAYLSDVPDVVFGQV